VGNSGTVTLNDPGQGVQGILGTVDVGGSTNLIVDDTGDTSPHGYIEFKDVSEYQSPSLSGLAPAPITWGGISSLTVTGGSGDNYYSFDLNGNEPALTLNAGPGNDTVGVDIDPMSQFALTVHGGPGNDQLTVGSVAPGAQLQSSPTTQSSGKVSVYLPPNKWNGPQCLIVYDEIKTLIVGPNTPSGPGNGKNHPHLPPGYVPPEQVPQQHPKHHKAKGQGGHPHPSGHRARHSTRAKRAGHRNGASQR
jgi:hypothetical protein